MRSGHIAPRDSFCRLRRAIAPVKLLLVCIRASATLFLLLITETYETSNSGVVGFSLVRYEMKEMCMDAFHKIRVKLGKLLYLQCLYTKHAIDELHFKVCIRHYDTNISLIIIG